MLVVLVHNLSYISIHAPARGATRSYCDRMADH